MQVVVVKYNKKQPLNLAGTAPVWEAVWEKIILPTQGFRLKLNKATFGASVFGGGIKAAAKEKS